MISRKFEKIQGQPSLLGFGQMRLPLVKEGSSDIDYEAGQKMVDYAFEHGVNYFDTAYPYHEGKSEAFIGHALKKYPRESFYLADKLPSWELKTSDDVERIFKIQLERCQVEYFDFYLCHAMNKAHFENYKKLGVYDILAQYKKEGKIRHLGFSFHDAPEVLQEMVDTYEWDFAQIQLNYLDWERQDAKRQYEILAEKDIPVVIMEPVRGGTLAALSPEAVEVFKAADANVSVASWAIRYAASLPGVMTVLSGMTNFEQMVDNVATMSDFKPLTDEEQAVVDKARNVFLANTTVPCTACRYCMDCPAGVDIPAMFKVYNDYKIGKHGAGFVSAYENMKDHNAHACVACGACMTHCPQSIQIPDLMTEIRNCYESLKN